MTAEALLSLHGNIAVLVKAEELFIITDLARAKQEQLKLKDTLTMDIDGSGTVDEKDINFIKKKLFSSFI